MTSPSSPGKDSSPSSPIKDNLSDSPYPWAFCPNDATSGQAQPSSYTDRLTTFYNLRDNPDPKQLAGALQSMNKDLNLVQEKWEQSSHRAAIVELVRERITPSDGFQIDNALCLGLGTFGWIEYEDSVMTAAQAEFLIKNHSFHQLLLFETVVDVLKEHFDIERVAFQDPEFTAEDVAFLQQRGHTVIPYPASARAEYSNEHGLPLDPSLVQSFSSATFLFSPWSPYVVLIPVVHALRPLLFLGTDFATVVANKQFSQPDAPTAPFMEDFKTFAWSRDFQYIGSLGRDQGFHWARDPAHGAALEQMRMRVQSWQGMRAAVDAAVEEWEVKTQREEAERRAVPEEALKMQQETKERQQKEKVMTSLEEEFRAFWRNRVEKKDAAEKRRDIC